MGMPEGYSVRPPTLEDVPAIAAILLADDLVSTGRSDYDEDFVRDQWATSGFDPSVDSWVVDGPNGVVASAHVMPGDPSPLRSWGVVHPDHRGRGIGSALLDRIEARTIERMDGIGEARLHHSITDADEAARAMLVERGYAFVRSFRNRVSIFMQ
jgi:mycothiol synthase